MWKIGRGLITYQRLSVCFLVVLSRPSLPPSTRVILSSYLRRLLRFLFACHLSSKIRKLCLVCSCCALHTCSRSLRQHQVMGGVGDDIMEEEDFQPHPWLRNVVDQTQQCLVAFDQPRTSSLCSSPSHSYSRLSHTCTSHPPTRDTRRPAYNTGLNQRKDQRRGTRHLKINTNSRMPWPPSAWRRSTSTT